MTVTAYLDTSVFDHLFRRIGITDATFGALVALLARVTSAGVIDGGMNL